MRVRCCESGGYASRAVDGGATGNSAENAFFGWHIADVALKFRDLRTWVGRPSSAADGRVIDRKSTVTMLRRKRPTLRVRSKPIAVGVLAVHCSVAVVWAALARDDDAHAPRLAAYAPPVEMQLVTYATVEDDAAAPPLVPLRLPEMPAGRPSDADRSARTARRKPDPVRRELFTVTAYCPCRKCCGTWSRDGRTASGRSIHYNGGCFVAADTSVLPFYTKVSVPGYAGGRPVPVLDRGRDVRGRHIDVFFRSHSRAKRWGSRKMWIKIYR
jgi:3D (Asp-Asp-Asp) domain-containing protein